jgi:hypothetical protein
MTPRRARSIVLVLLVLSLALLAPGLFAPVLTIRGVLTPDGVANVAPVVLERGLTDETVAELESMMSPTLLAFVKSSGGDVRKVVIDRLVPKLTAALGEGISEVEVYGQTRSIVSSVRRLYEVGSPVPATLILLFSVVVPLVKASLVAVAVFGAPERSRRRILAFVEAIAKWSMADVFVVALFIAYLAAQASAAPTSGPAAIAPLVAFSAHFGPGFYWFAAYCLFSLASQQFTYRAAEASLRAAEPTPET